MTLGPAFILHESLQKIFYQKYLRMPHLGEGLIRKFYSCFDMFHRILVAIALSTTTAIEASTFGLDLIFESSALSR